MTNVIKKFISKITGKQVQDGFGFSNDDNIKLDKIPVVLTEGKPVYKNTATYSLSNEAGLFELVGFRRTEKGNSSVTLRCNITGDTFTISKNLFSLLFKKHT
jgi:hypothetical protein